MRSKGERDGRECEYKPSATMSQGATATGNGVRTPDRVKFRDTLGARSLLRPVDPTRMVKPWRTRRPDNPNLDQHLQIGFILRCALCTLPLFFTRPASIKPKNLELEPCAPLTVTVQR
jgi:hypothetical protein